MIERERLAKTERKILESPVGGRERLWYMLAFVALWSSVSYFDLVNPLILPPPSSIFRASVNIGSPLAWHALSTTLRALVGLLIGTSIGIFLGLFIRYNRAAKLVFEPLLDASRPVPAIALLPFFILIFGFSEFGRVALVSISVIVVVAVATVEGAESMPESWFRFALVSGFSRAKIFYKIVLPGIVPWLRGPLRIALALSFTLVIASEFMGAQEGLGYLINVARVNLATPTIVLCAIVLGVVAQILDIVLNYVIWNLTFWYQGTRSITAGG